MRVENERWSMGCANCYALGPLIPTHEWVLAFVEIGQPILLPCLLHCDRL